MYCILLLVAATLLKAYSRSMKGSSSLINKELFNKCEMAVALKIPAKSCSGYMNTFKDFIFDKPKMARIRPVPGYVNSFCVDFGRVE